jgi:D-glycero-D-manno-heptose 1,7-bisphosphate phosphatase
MSSLELIFLAPLAKCYLFYRIIYFVFPAIFLDRDGVIIENRSDYVRSWEDVHVFPQALEALANASASPYKIVFVTNQSAVGRGLMSLATAEAINCRLKALIEDAGGRVDGIFLCPHAPEAACDCRKPKPGLLLQAAQALDLDLARSVMIGDALTDLMAGQAAGVRRLALVRSGRGADQDRLPKPESLKQYQTYDSLTSALEDILDGG